MEFKKQLKKEDSKTAIFEDEMIQVIHRAALSLTTTLANITMNWAQLAELS